MSIYEYDEELHKKTLHDEGYEDGFNNGILSKLIEQICCKLRKNKSPEIIADELEEDIGTVKYICDAARSFAPEYDEKEIMKKMKAEKEESPL